jgi:hypothetical protein
VHGELRRGLYSADAATLPAERVLEDVAGEDEDRALVASRRRVAHPVALARTEENRRVRVDDGRPASTMKHEDALPRHHELRLAAPLLPAARRARRTTRNVGHANDRAVEEKCRTPLAHADIEAIGRAATALRKWSQRDSNP